MKNMENSNQDQRPRGQRRTGGGPNQNQGRPQNNAGLQAPGSGSSRGAAMRAQKRATADAQKIANQYAPAQVAAQPRRANLITDDFDKLKITFLGGQNGIGE